LGFDVISVKQIAAKYLSPEGPITSISLPLFSVTLAHCQKSQTIFSLKSMPYFLIKIEAYAAQTGLTQCPKYVSDAGIVIVTESARKKAKTPAN
jgi:hypothetical protein